MIEVKAKVGKEEIVVSTGVLAKQADGSVTVRCGGTVVLVTCVCSREAKEGMSFFPLTVEYQEKTYASGRIPGGFFKREGRPTEKEILTSRMIDRPIRPLFPEGMRNELQVVATVLSSDGKNDSDVLAMVGASAALTISDIPFDGPIGGVRVGLINDEYVINPTFDEMENSILDLVVVSNDESVVMLETGAEKISEEQIIKGIKAGHEAIKATIDMQKELQKKVGKAKREDIAFTVIDEELYAEIKKKATKKLLEAHLIPEKQERREKLALVNKSFYE